jgi:hypothetical protein
MAGNDLLNGFQAGMQAFAPLVNATLQRKKDERDTAARMGELRLQSELQGSRDANQNTFAAEQQGRAQTFSAEESALERKAREDLAARSAEQRREEFRATFGASRLDAGMSYSLGKERLSLESKSLAQRDDHFKLTQTEQGRMFDQRITLDERELALKRRLAAKTLNPVMSLANDIGDTVAERDNLFALSQDLALSDFERKDAHRRATVLSTALDMTMQNANGMLNDPALKPGQAFGAIQSMFKRNPLPIESKTVSVTDSLGATDVGQVGAGPDGKPALLMLPRILAPGGTPPRPAVTPADAAGKKKPNVPAKKAF